MPTPTFYEKQALRLEHYTWWFFAASIVMVLAYAFSFSLSAFFSKAAFTIVPSLIFVLVAWSWGLFLICKWFHPQRGVFGHGSSSSAFSALFRGWCSLVLTAMFVVPFLSSSCAPCIETRRNERLLSSVQVVKTSKRSRLVLSVI